MSKDEVKKVRRVNVAAVMMNFFMSGISRGRQEVAAKRKARGGKAKAGCNKYVPHQGAKEKARRARKLGKQS